MVILVMKMARKKINKKKKIGTKLNINKKEQQRQVNSVLSLYDDMAKDVDKTLAPLFESKQAEKLVFSATDESVSSSIKSAISKLRRKWNKVFLDHANTFTDKLVKQSNSSVVTGLNKTLKDAGVNQTIKVNSMSQRARDVVSAASAESVNKIKTISGVYMDSANSALNYSVTQSSATLSDLKGFFDASLKDQYRTYKNKAKNLALDQTRNVFNSIATERMRDVGMTRYIWRHAGGSQNPREYHKNVLNGQEFDINDPPVIDKKTGKKGNAGDIYGCGCYKELIVDFDIL